MSGWSMFWLVCFALSYCVAVLNGTEVKRLRRLLPKEWEDGYNFRMAEERGEVVYIDPQQTPVVGLRTPTPPQAD